MVRKKRESCTRRGNGSSRNGKQRPRNKTIFKTFVEEFIPPTGLFSESQFHGNIKWNPEQLCQQALIWSWQDTVKVTDAFNQTEEICTDLSIDRRAKTYTAFINALDRYRSIFSDRLRQRFQHLAEHLAGRFWRKAGWVLMGFDGSRVTAPRTTSNEKAFCAPNYGTGKTARYRKKQTKGMRRRNNERNKAQPQTPQVWITMMWHMALRLPWTWRLGPSNSSERGHVMEMLEGEKFPENTLFCGDAGFVGYPLWNAILEAGGDFLVRVGANVSLLSEAADVKHHGGGIVLCWPKGKMNSGAKPLRLRLVRIKIGKTKMWMLTSVLDRRKLPNKKIKKYYEMRWGIEVEFRGLKQTIDKRKLRCRNSNRVYVELDWSIRAMAIAELMALREQLRKNKQRQQPAATNYEPAHRSLANTMRALRKCLRNLGKSVDPDDDLLSELSRALVQRYNNGTDKRSRYRPKNPDKKPLGEPKIRKLNREQRRKLEKINHRLAA